MKSGGGNKGLVGPPVSNGGFGPPVLMGGEGIPGPPVYQGDPLQTLASMVGGFVVGRNPWIKTPTSVMTVSSIDPVARTVQLLHAGAIAPEGYNYPYLHSYIPFLGDIVLVQNFPSGPVVYGPLSGGAASPAGITPGSGLGTGGGGVSFTGTNLGGTVSFTTGTGPTASSMVTVTFSSPLPSAKPNVLLTAANSNAAKFTAFVTLNTSGNTTTSWTLSYAVAPTASQIYSYHYVVWAYV